MSQKDFTLMNALEKLNRELAKESMLIHLSIIGRYAFFLSGIGSLATLDIDTVTSIDDRVIQKICEIGESEGLSPDWLNSNAEILPLPEGFQSRLVDGTHYSNIKIKYASRIDLIALKSAAYVSRGEDDPKDYQDLKLLKPNDFEIEAAINYIRTHYSPPVSKFFPDFEEKLDELRLIPKK